MRKKPKSSRGGLTPTCHHCGGKIFLVSSGVVCDECVAKIKPSSHVIAQSVLPISWKDVGIIIGRGRVAFDGHQPETLEEQNDRLAEHGERQRPLFTEY